MDACRSKQMLERHMPAGFIAVQTVTCFCNICILHPESPSLQLNLMAHPPPVLDYHDSYSLQLDSFGTAAGSHMHSCV